MMDNNEYFISGSFWNLVSAALSTAVAGMFALLSLAGVYHAPRIVRAEVLSADSNSNPA